MTSKSSRKKATSFLPTFVFNLSRHRTYRSAYGGFALFHLSVCGKLFSTIPSRNITFILLSNSVLLSWIKSFLRISDYKRLSG